MNRTQRYDSLDDFAATLPSRFAEIAEKLRGESGSFLLRTRQGRTRSILLGNGLVTVTEGAVEAPDCTVDADEADLLALVNGDLNPMKALLFGKVRIHGNKALLLKLASLA